MIRTQYYAQGDFGLPLFQGPAELNALGNWVTGDIQLSPLSILEAIDLVRLAQADPGFTPEEMDGNAHTATFSSQGVAIENHFAEHVQGEFLLDKALAVLLDFWDYYLLAHPEKISRPTGASTRRRTVGTRSRGFETLRCDSLSKES
ncbi:hypothetical protein RKE30_07405 [Streptomyces sp. Li-HN-5-11]|uniref:hypothetical protein n=1 Tax=Streptomyces sp. Li-HN-5-11 TaxID=3075432 RepID=UPI0028A76DA1|nr:hypothetical protein [Streptomyces sp. Li-HN-5-11]WNM30243.1 hypothetical protein RKE30_07405 [Streptomyces sp. Li-HN-5-11]